MPISLTPTPSSPGGPFSEDLDLFLADFGVPSTLQGGTAGGVLAIYDEPYQGDLGMAGTNPTALVKASAVAESDIGATLTRTDTGVVYTIRNREPLDDGAFVRLQLQG
jgi:hypothetical protein